MRGAFSATAVDRYGVVSEYATNHEGEGLWRGDSQQTGTMQFSAASAAGFRRQLRCYLGDDAVVFAARSARCEALARRRRAEARSEARAYQAALDECERIGHVRSGSSCGRCWLPWSLCVDPAEHGEDER